MAIKAGKYEIGSEHFSKITRFYAFTKLAQLMVSGGFRLHKY
jgi:hypothetical protein